MTQLAPLVSGHDTLRARPGVSTRSLSVRRGTSHLRSAVTSPLRAFAIPTTPATPLAFGLVRLGVGRLHAPDAVAAVTLAELERVSR